VLFCNSVLNIFSDSINLPLLFHDNCAFWRTLSCNSFTLTVVESVLFIALKARLSFERNCDCDTPRERETYQVHSTFHPLRLIKQSYPRERFNSHFTWLEGFVLHRHFFSIRNRPTASSESATFPHPVKHEKHKILANQEAFLLVTFIYLQGCNTTEESSKRFLIFSHIPHHLTIVHVSVVRLQEQKL